MGSRMALELQSHEVPVFLDRLQRTLGGNRPIPETSNGLGQCVSEEFLNKIDFSEMGHLVALTSNDVVNAFVEQTLSGYMADPYIYHLKPSDNSNSPFGDAKKNITPLFSEDVDFDKLEEMFVQGAKFKPSQLSGKYDWNSFQNEHQSADLPLFCIFANKQVAVFNSRKPPNPKAGDTIMYALHNTGNKPSNSNK